MRTLNHHELSFVSGGFGDHPPCGNTPTDGTCVLPSGNTITDGVVDDISPIDWPGVFIDLVIIGAGSIGGAGSAIRGVVTTVIGGGAQAAKDERNENQQSSQ